MAFYFHPDVLDNGISLIKANAERYALIKDYTVLDSYATVVSKIAAVTATITTDYTLGDQGTNGRQLTVAAFPTIPVTAATIIGTNNLHFAWLDDTNSKVLAVTDETSNRSLEIGDNVTLPLINMKMNQPA